MNVELLRQVQERIKAEPQLFQMPALFEETDCGTACCIWGWAMAIQGIATNETEWMQRDTPDPWETFDFDEDDFDPDDLISSSDWPEPFRSEFKAAEKANDKVAQAEIACRRIDYLIETGE